MENIFKNALLEIIKQRNIIDENKPLTYTLKLENRVNKLSEAQCEKLIFSVLEDISPERKSVMSGIGMGSLAGALGPIFILYRAVRGKFDKCSKACGVYVINGPKRQTCMAKCNVMKYQEIVNGLKKIKAPKDKILKAELKLKDYEQKYKEYLNYARQTGRKYEINVKPGDKNRFHTPIKNV